MKFLVQHFEVKICSILRQQGVGNYGPLAIHVPIKKSSQG
jgi:hypothetical protein